MLRSDFDYFLPPDRIAQQPSRSRSESRLLCLERGTDLVDDRHFTDLTQYLHAGDLLVFNDTRVIPARLFGQKETGGKVEILLERVLDESLALVQLKASKSPGAGAILRLDDGILARVERRDGPFFVLRSLGLPILDVFTSHGHMPLPPYIERADTAEDLQRYQTVYARVPGAVAAPTAGLHFDQAMLEVLADRGIEQAFVTLHVGAGTFQPVRSENLDDHVMHAEYFQVDEHTCTAVNKAREEGRRVIAVGTTVVRALEAASSHGRVSPFRGETDIFIVPGYKFQIIDALITNFHLPQSTLLMLVCAFAGYDEVRKAYLHAVDANYRFYSYGDAMFLYS